MASVLGDHRRNTHHTHDQENSEEDYGDYKDRHMAPLD